MSKERVHEARKMLKVEKYGGVFSAIFGFVCVLFGVYFIGRLQGAVLFIEPNEMGLAQAAVIFLMLFGFTLVGDGVFDVYLAMKMDRILREVEEKLEP